MGWETMRGASSEVFGPEVAALLAAMVRYEASGGDIQG
jgi:hypothetical protein